MAARIYNPAPRQRNDGAVAVEKGSRGVRYVEVDLAGVGLRLDGRPVLRSIDWRIRPGERFPEPMGVRDEIAYVGAERQDRYEHYEWNHRVATVVGTGLTRSDIPQGPLTAAQRAEVCRLLARLGIEALAWRRFLTLSYGQRRLALFARAWVGEPDILLLDEPYAGLDARTRHVLARAVYCGVVRRRDGKGVT
jgi:molybdate transport system ATP-binding protein